MSDQARVARFGEVLARLDDEIDWDVCASVYCEGDATGFFSPERREAVLDAGLKLGADVAEALGNRPGRSLYVGAAIAELAPILMEAIVLGRDVRWQTLKSAESTELARALGAVDGSLPRPAFARWRGSDVGPCDHIWMTSVLTDPDAFPALHDRLYRRQGTTEAVKGGHPKAERARAAELIEECLFAAAHETLLTTTDEELELWGPAIQQAGGRLDVERTGRLSGLVGDIVRQGRLKFPGGPS